MKPTQEQLHDLLTRGVESVIEAESLKKKLLSGRKLRIKHGVDPTSKDLHIGYGVVYQKLKAFQQLGHTIVFLVGDFTARFGDPTDKHQSRQLRTKREVEAAAKSYIAQIGKVLNVQKTEIRRNSEWYDVMSAEELLRLQSSFTVSQLLERDMFQRRMKEQKEIGYHEPVYPILQAYDSVMLKADVTVIGTDQTFNELQARVLQRQAGQAPQDIIGMRLLVGTDGQRKMSQSLGNYIALAASPAEMYGKIMSIPDHAVLDYFELATTIPLSQVEEYRRELHAGVNPRSIKAKLAEAVVATYHSAAKAAKAAADFERVFSRKELPRTIPPLKNPGGGATILDLLVSTKTVASKSEARRLVQQGAVTVNGVVVNDISLAADFTAGTILQVGKRRFFKIT